MEIAQGSITIKNDLLAAWNQSLAGIIRNGVDDAAIAELVAALEGLAGGSSSMIIIYPQAQRPYIPHHRLLPEEDPALHIDQYLGGAYLVDPSYLYAIEEGVEGVFSIMDIAPDGFEDSEYFRIYYHAVDLVDEACFIMQGPGHSTVMISLGRHSGDPLFQAEEIKLLQTMFVIVKETVSKWLESSDIDAPGQGLETHLDAALVNFGTSLLTPRESVIVNLLLRGYSIKSIAQRLKNSDETIKHHRKNIYTKLDISTQAELFYLFIDSLRSSTLDTDTDPLIAYMSIRE